ncbi:MAG: aspartate-semialdehyde dehydrogenase [Bacteroidales bacterium]|jgi:aspartate-semialdehyde dehydrogenase
MKVAVVGATGLVGREMIKVLESRNFPVDELIAVASGRSIGLTVPFKGKEVYVVSVENAIRQQPEIVLFSAGGSVSLEWAPKFAAYGGKVIDNSSAWRMHENIPLVVPEVNGHVLTVDDHIIANPNCSTIQLVMALAPLHHAYTIKRVVVSTYQSVSGSGKKGIDQMMSERADLPHQRFYPHQIDLNVLPHAGDFDLDGNTTEEMKLTNETKKILDPAILLTSTVVRVPVKGGHSEAVNIEFKHDFTIPEVRRLLGGMPGVVVVDYPEANLYPMPLMAEGKDEVFVGRIRRDTTRDNSLNMWVVSDNLRKGAATNAVQIAEILLSKKLV